MKQPDQAKKAVPIACSSDHPCLICGAKSHPCYWTDNSILCDIGGKAPKGYESVGASPSGQYTYVKKEVFEPATEQKPIDMDAPRFVQEYHKLHEAMGKRIRLNTLTKEVELDGNVVNLEKIRLDLAIDHDIYLKSSNEDVSDMVIKIAESNQYSPIIEYLEQVYQTYGADNSILYGDGAEKLSLAARYFGQYIPIYNTFAVRTLIAAVARVYQPGCKHDCTLILQGDQGLYKSSWFKILAGDEWFDDSMGAHNDKDEKLKLHQVWFTEWAELESIFGRKDISATKSFLSSATDRIRPPYARSIQRMPRQSIIVGTTNKDEFLSDPTGNRRFWIIPCTKRVDRDLLKEERDRIWAAAVALYKAGEQWYLTLEEEQQANAIAQEFHTRDPWYDLIVSYVSEKTLVSTREILDDLLKIESGRQERGQLMRVADILRELGWKKALRQHNFKRQRVWVAPEPPSPPEPPCSQQVDHPLSSYAANVSDASDPPDPPSESNLSEPQDPPLQPAFSQISNFYGSGGSGGSNNGKSTLLEAQPVLKDGSGGSGKVDQSKNSHFSVLKEGDRVRYIGKKFNLPDDLTLYGFQDGHACCEKPDGGLTTWIPLGDLRRCGGD